MKPYEYMLATRETAIYPKEVALPYLVLGLTGEIGELLHADSDNLAKEAGDCMWYAFRIIDECHVAISGEWEYKEADTPADSPMLRYTVGTYVHASRLAEIAKKVIRDNNGKIPESKVDDILDNVISILGILQSIIELYGLTLEQCAIANIEKLMSRKHRNVIQGSGDER
jgi:hypothetical protein